MEQFAMVALAHFTALLLPGPDFFLIARTSLRSGWRSASGACAGITLANAVFIVVAFSGISVAERDSNVIRWVQWLGVAYLLYLGQLFVRSGAKKSLAQVQPVACALDGVRWGKALVLGFLSGILNPKNALFYASLAAALAEPLQQVHLAWLYGIWMVGMVGLWDMLVALFVGNAWVFKRFALALPYVEVVSGLILIGTALGMAMWAWAA